MSELILRANLTPLTYLATPYTYKSPDAAVRATVQKLRFEVATRAAGWLINKFGWNVFSPITHSHPMHLLCPNIRGDWPFWKKIDTEYLQISQRIVILTIHGWRSSTGVIAESEISRDMGLPFHYIHPRDDGDFLFTDEPQDGFYNPKVQLF